MGYKHKRADHLGRYQCSTCHLWKSPHEYYAGGTKDGLMSECKVCHNLRKKNRRAVRKLELEALRTTPARPAHMSQEDIDEALETATAGWDEWAASLPTPGLDKEVDTNG